MELSPEQIEMQIELQSHLIAGFFRHAIRNGWIREAEFHELVKGGLPDVVPVQEYQRLVEPFRDLMPKPPR